MLHFVAPWIAVSCKRPGRCSTVAPCTGGEGPPSSSLPSRFNVSTFQTLNAIFVSPTQSRLVQASPATPPPPGEAIGKETVKFLALFDHLLVLFLLLAFGSVSKAAQSNDYASVDAIFGKYCLDCHASKDPEGDLVLESFNTVMKGGEIGPAVLPGKSSQSLLVQMVEGRFEKEGKKKIMPPGKRAKLTPAEIATLKSWIDAGAPAPAAPLAARELVVPKILPKCVPRNPINTLACSQSVDLIAAGRYAEVELLSTTKMARVRLLGNLRGNVNALVFTQDGSRLFAASGQPGLSGEVHQWSIPDGKLIQTLNGHKDAIYSMVLSPDEKILATGSYDQKIKLWDAETGKELKTLSGHNGCVFGLAFRPDGKILASASADRTVKLWDVASGERRDTLSQPLKDVYAVAFSPDGKRLAAGGVDNRIRVWEISESAAETTNPILYSKFAHEGTILRLAFSPNGETLASSADDRTIKLWHAKDMHERRVLEPQPDWAAGLAFVGNAKLAVGRLDGTVHVYDLPTANSSTAAK